MQKKVLYSYKNTNRIYKGIYINDYSKEEFNKLGINKNTENSFEIIEVNKVNALNSIIVEVFNRDKILIQTFYANKDCINWLCTTELTNNYNSAKNAIDRCVNNGKAYKDTYYFKKYSNSQYTEKQLNN